MLYTLTKNFIEVQRNMLNPFVIILFYKVVWWFNGQNIGVKPRTPRFNPPYQHILCQINIFVYIYCTCV
jgi:hypothetical protein